MGMVLGDKLREAASFLIELLAGTEMLYQEVLVLFEQRGISRSTLYKARGLVQVEWRRIMPEMATILSLPESAKDIDVEKKVSEFYGASPKDVSFCANCNAEIVREYGRPRRRFCDRKCSKAYWVSVPDNPSAPKLVHKFTCVYCGTPFYFYRHAKHQVKKYCTRQCYSLAIKFVNHGDNIPEATLIERAVEMRALGKTLGQIADALLVSKHTVAEWMKSYEKECAGVVDWEPSELYLYSKARTANEWLAALKRELEISKTKINHTDSFNCSVYLICGVTSLKKGADQLSMIVQERFKLDPFSGDVFAFCSLSRERIKYIQWDGLGFRVVSRYKQQGVYRWPNKYIGDVAEITGREFCFLLEHAGRRRIDKK